jgi:glycerol kinase
VSPQLEATTLGAGFLAGLAIGTWSSEDDIFETWRPARTVEPKGSFSRERWKDACQRASGWLPELSSLDF